MVDVFLLVLPLVHEFYGGAAALWGQTVLQGLVVSLYEHGDVRGFYGASPKIPRSLFALLSHLKEKRL